MIQRDILPIAILLTLALSCSGKDYEEYFNQGFKARTEQKFALAEKFYLKALEKRKTPEVYKELGNVYLFGDRDLNRAEKNYRLSLNVDPNYLNALHNMGVINLERYADSLNKKGIGESRFLDTGEKWFKKALKAGPDFDLTYTNLGKLYFYRKKYKKAIKRFSKAITLNKENPLPYTGIGEVYLVQKKYVKALENLEKSYDISVNVPETALLMARVYKHNIDKPKMRHYYGIYLKLLIAQNRKREYKKAKREKKEFGL